MQNTRVNSRAGKPVSFTAQDNEIRHYSQPLTWPFLLFPIKQSRVLTTVSSVSPALRTVGEVQLLVK